MRRDFSEETALKIMNAKLRGKSQNAVYELSDAELAVLRNALEYWTVGMSQVLAEKIGDMDKTQKLIRDTIKLPESERVRLANNASASFDLGEIPSHPEFAAFILSNHSDQIHIEEEIKRRERIN